MTIGKLSKVETLFCSTKTKKKQKCSSLQQNKVTGSRLEPKNILILILVSKETQEVRTPEWTIPSE